MKLSGNGVIVQSGGPTAVINNSICGVIWGWQKWAAGNGTLYGALYGIRGMLEDNLINLSALDQRTFNALGYTPGAALGSCRYKLTADEDYMELLQSFKKRNVRYLFVVGGNDSMDTADKVHRLARREKYEMRVIGVPKTIDNDLPFTDHCPGYGSAAKYLATTVLESGIDLETLITSNRIVILEAMGRNAGWLTAAAALARRGRGEAPHLLYLPEVPFNREQFLEEVEEVYRDRGYAYVVASEGLKDSSGRYVFAGSGKDSFGHARLGGLGDTLKGLVEENMGVKVRCLNLGTAQRASAHYLSRVDNEEAFLVGRQAVRLALSGHSGLMVTLVREETDYACRTGSIELDRVANVEKKMPLEWISPAGNDVTAAFLEYARPLIRGEVALPTREGLPDYTRLPGLARYRSRAAGECRPAV
ncbi:MAG: 6-phosphofructokinase [Firmicutes bacterium]|nr:6-phosphofructokinase [Bacillota bacterium]